MTVAETQQDPARALEPSTAATSGRLALAGTLRMETVILLTPAVILMALGAVLTVFVRGDDLLPGELASTRWLSRLDNPIVLDISEFLDFISEFEVAPVVFAILLPIVWLLWGRRALFLFGVSGSITAFTRVTDLADRARPTPDFRFDEIVKEPGIYPSGHVFYGVLVFGMIAYLAWKHMPPSVARTAVIGLMAAMAVLMGPSRVIELDHWPADAFGSYLLAIPFFLLLIWLDRHPATQPGSRLHSIADAGRRVEVRVRRRLHLGRH